MAERKSVNKYYPPDWDPTKGSVNKYVGQHPLRDRARKLGQGILVIRFEMPYNIWCGGCGSHIGMGVRYNAEKKKVGNYYSTPIYLFKMKCHLCDNYFEIQTDPKNHDYVIKCGAKRKEQRWDPKANGQIETEDKATQKKMATDAMYKLEHGSDDQQKGKKGVTSLGQLEDRMDQYKDDYMINKIAREKFRNEKKRIKEEASLDMALLKKSSLDINLVEESEDDIKLAGLLKYRSTASYDEKQLQKRKEIELRPIFTKPSEKKESTFSAGNIKQQLAAKIHTSQRSPFDYVKDNKTDKNNVVKSLGICKKVKTKGHLHQGKSNDGAETLNAASISDDMDTGSVDDGDAEDCSFITADNTNSNCDKKIDEDCEIETVDTSTTLNTSTNSGLGLVLAYCDSSSEESDIT